MKHKYKVGDRVKVTHAVYTTGVHWALDMDRCIGHTGLIKLVFKNSVFIDFDDITQKKALYNNRWPYWYFPIESITKVDQQLLFSFMEG